MTDPALEYLLGKAAKSFMADAFERKPLIIRHGEPARFLDLLSIARVDRIVTEHDLREGALVLADAEREVLTEDYVTGSGAIDRAATAGAYARGATIILNQLHQSDAALARFCRSMEAIFSCHVQMNVYLTPPGNQGFHTHYDNHDVFVLQVEGEKAWRLYDQIEAPYRGEGFKRGMIPEDAVPSDSFTLKAGDCLYIPRGLVHDAVASGDTPSLHITCGLIVRTWAELMLEAVSEVCVTEPAFRTSLPPGFAARDFDRTGAGATFHKLMGLIAERAQLDNALNLMADAQIRSREPDLSGAILRAGRPAEGRYAATGAPWRLAGEEDGRVQVVAPYGDTSFPVDQWPEVERMLSGETFEAASLDENGRGALTKLLGRGMVAPVA